MFVSAYYQIRLVFGYHRNTSDLGDKTMADKLMYISNEDTQNDPSLDNNYFLDAQLNEPTNRNSIKVHTLLRNVIIILCIQQKYTFYISKKGVLL